MGKNLKKHLNFEKQENSKEFKLNRCMSILGMIAILKDRNSIIHEHTGNLFCYKNFAKLQANLKTIKRLEGYFDYSLKKIDKFN